MWQKSGSPLKTTINHKSGKGVENKTYGIQKCEKCTEKDPKTEVEMKVG